MMIDWPSLYLGMALALPFYLLMEVAVVPPLDAFIEKSPSPLARLMRRDRGD